MSLSVYAHHAVLVLSQAGGHKPFNISAEHTSQWRLMTTLQIIYIFTEVLMMTIEYDPKILEKSSRNLYWSAEITAKLFPIVGAVVGGAAGYKMFKLVGAVVGAGVIGYAGYRYGDIKATEARSQAQTSLCLASIEQNTRTAATSAEQVASTVERS